jgi:hypothetical protein
MTTIRPLVLVATSLLVSCDHRPTPPPSSPDAGVAQPCTPVTVPTADAVPAIPPPVVPPAGAIPGACGQRISLPFAEQKLRSPNARVRHDLVWRLDPYETEPYLRALLADPEPTVREKAFEHLASNGFAVDRKEVPRGLKGLDPADPAGLQRRLEDLRSAVRAAPLQSSDAIPGHAAVLVGVFGDASDLQSLMNLTGHANVFVRFSAANALLALGAPEPAKATLRRIADVPTAPDNLFYKRNALSVLSRLKDSGATAQLIDFLSELEPSAELNARSHYVTLLSVLAAVHCVWHDDAAGWRQWLASQPRP